MRNIWESLLALISNLLKQAKDIEQSLKQDSFLTLLTSSTRSFFKPTVIRALGWNKVSLWLTLTFSREIQFVMVSRDSNTLLRQA